jgi:hypothetical protein
MTFREAPGQSDAASRALLFGKRNLVRGTYRQAEAAANAALHVVVLALEQIEGI